ncbi:MAG: MYG1 family protein [Chlamydiae bacterium]|nr:MYG1 family protein [Chlamydiota bacterium]
MDTKMIPRSCGTHNGSFHADEVTACALLLVFDLIDEDKIVRTRDPEKLQKCEYVCDVGGIYDPQSKRLDHHQIDYQGELSSAGMVLLYIKVNQIIDETIYNFLNHSLILGVDAHDNGRVSYTVGHCSFSNVISNFVPIRYDANEEMQNAAFSDALHFVVGHLQRLLQRYRYMQSCREEVIASMATQEIYLHFSQALPWMDIFFELGGERHPAKFVIMPSGDHWKLRGIPPNSQDRMKVRLPLPENWAGLLEKDLEKVTGIPGAIFCHKGRFISVWKTKEDALLALQKILEMERK